MGTPAFALIAVALVVALVWKARLNERWSRDPLDPESRYMPAVVRLTWVLLGLALVNLTVSVLRTFR